MLVFLPWSRWGFAVPVGILFCLFRFQMPRLHQSQHHNSRWLRCSAPSVPSVAVVCSFPCKPQNTDVKSLNTEIFRHCVYKQVNNAWFFTPSQAFNLSPFSVSVDLFPSFYALQLLHTLQEVDLWVTWKARFFSMFSNVRIWRLVCRKRKRLFHSEWTDEAAWPSLVFSCGGALSHRQRSCRSRFAVSIHSCRKLEMVLWVSWSMGGVLAACIKGSGRRVCAVCTWKCSQVLKWLRRTISDLREYYGLYGRMTIHNIYKRKCFRNNNFDWVSVFSRSHVSGPICFNIF